MVYVAPAWRRMIQSPAPPAFAVAMAARRVPPVPSSWVFDTAIVVVAADATPPGEAAAIPADRVAAASSIAVVRRRFEWGVGWVVLMVRLLGWGRGCGVL